MISMRKWFACNKMLLTRQEKERMKKYLYVRQHRCPHDAYSFFTPECRTNEKKKTKDNS